MVDLPIPEVQGPNPAQKVFALHDGAKFHWGPEAKAAMATHLIQFFVDFPAYSPDLNPIENVFGILDLELAKRAVSHPLKSVKATLDRAAKLTAKIGETDYIESMVSSMPNRLQEVINAKGGPTRY
jgi:hypothetical protein